MDWIANHEHFYNYPICSLKRESFDLSKVQNRHIGLLYAVYASNCFSFEVGQ